MGLRAWDKPLYRVQGSVPHSGSLGTEAYPTPLHRFDAPAGRYPITYANDSRVGVFAEVYVDRGRRLGMEDADRRLVRIEPDAPLPVLDLLSDDTLGLLDLDERISTGDDYERCQQWALKAYESFEELCGIRYGARCAGRRTANYALFADRCASRVEARDLGRLADLADVVLAAADVYKLRVRFLA
ncbi:RES domain-containing protein (plasmid) [Rubrobacter marinus]|uniref:RES domain-containing protein n=1 Tax=Rubrobacter marinus TaxID=2653852 RepID=A0A6G8Q3H5_9ACTN|nr:RES domain-containing protein [Rubrobacter marinus]QIN81009.1 RES domain-containing protein [Rubrobacter marinus]